MPTLYQEWRTTPDGSRVRDLEATIAMIMLRSPLMRFITFGSPAQSHKHEWQEEIRQQIVGTLTANIAAHAASAAGLTITLDDSSIFTVGDQVNVANFDPVYKVTAIPGGGLTLTVTEIRGFALGADAGSGSSITINRGRTEGTTFGNEKGATLPDQVYNVTQIFRRDISVTKNLEQQQLYGIESMFNRAIQQQAENLAWELKNAVVSGIRQERTSGESVGYMGGLRPYINDGTSACNVVTGSGALTVTNMNDLAKAIYDDMGSTDGIKIITSAEQSKVMATFGADKFIYNDPSAGRSIGSNVTQFIPDIPGASPMEIILDDQMGKNEIWYVNPEDIKLKPFQNRSFLAKIDPIAGADAHTAWIIGEYTLQYRNAKRRGGMISGISIPS